MSNRSPRARSGPSKAFLLFFIFICALSTWNAHAAGSYVAALPDDEIVQEVVICSLRANGPVYPIVRSSCLVTSMQKRWMSLYNRAIDTLNRDVNLACDETHAIFDNTSERVVKEFDILANGQNGERPILLPDHKATLKSWAEREVLVRLTNGRTARDNSCTQTSSNNNGNNSSNNGGSGGGGNTNLSLTGNSSGSTSNPANPPTNPPLTAPRITSLTSGESTNTTHSFSGPRVATSNLAGPSCSSREIPACDNAMMRCLRGCNSSGNVDACNGDCQREMLSCKGCGSN